MSSWQARARSVLAGGVSSQFRAADPVVFARGQGSRVWDLDGRESIDYTLSQGPLIHGHSHPAILAEVACALRDGQVWNGLHCREIELAEQLVSVIPCAEQIRFASTGSEAVHAALRAARATTGRSKFIKFEGHYHGWLDGVAGSVQPPLDAAGPASEPNVVPWCAGLASGALVDMVVLPWNDLAAVERAIVKGAGQIAAVITEPIMCNTGCIEPLPGFLAGLRRLCDRHGVVLIFDEVITGFRVARGGAQQRFGVVPDLAVFGKAFAGGFPISVVAGRQHVMRAISDAQAIHAGTLNGQVAGVAAAQASLRLLEANDGAALAQIESFGRRLMDAIRRELAAARIAATVTGCGAVFHVGFVNPGVVAAEPREYRDVVRTYDGARYGRFVRAMATRGVRLIGRGIWYVSTAHSDDDLQLTVARVHDALGETNETST